MGKSNKFDYTNRSNSGANFGHIIGTALQKEAEKVRKDAERHLQKARKQSTDSSSGTADAGCTTHIIDLRAPNKDLGDDGVCALVDGLEISLRSGTSQASLVLEDLNLSGNGITTRSLARLGPVIELAKYEIKTLNLADNNITVVNDDQAAQWESFLVAFRGCMKLRRLDVSGNAELGSRAMEVLARIHNGEPQISPRQPGGDAPLQSSTSDHSDSENEASMAQRSNLDYSGPDYFSSDMASPTTIKRRCGLRSIPYITLHNTGLDDAGALWLSYVLEDHFYPIQLIDELNTTQPDSQIKVYQQDSNFCGIDWNGNETLGKEGIQLLEKIEILRRRRLLEDRAADSQSTSGDANSVVDTDSERRVSLDVGSSRVAAGSRRVSVRSIRTLDGGEHETTELESARKKLKRHIIAHDGASSVELWKAALKYFQVSRSLLYIAPVCRKIYTGPPLFNAPAITIEGLDGTDGENTSFVDAIQPIKHTYARFLSPPEESRTSESAMTEVSNTPVTPMLLQRPKYRKGAFSEGTDIDTLMERLRINVADAQGSDRFVKYQQLRVTELAKHGHEVRDFSVPCNLPRHVIERVMRLVMSDREIRMMGDEQKKAAIQWSQRRDTLMIEREWLKKDESSQVLMLLDNIKCLTYGQ